MGLFWDFYWPILTAGMIIGLCAGWRGFRPRKIASRERIAGEKVLLQDHRRNRRFASSAGVLTAIAIALLWHLAGTGDRFADRVETRAKTLLVDFEMQAVRVTVDRHPLRRQVTLAGPADDFQRGELVRLMELLPGVSQAHWEQDRNALPLPLAVEACLLSLIGFSLGLFLAYLVELRRRSNAQWRW